MASRRTSSWIESISSVFTVRQYSSNLNNSRNHIPIQKQNATDGSTEVQFREFHHPGLFTFSANVSLSSALLRREKILIELKLKSLNEQQIPLSSNENSSTLTLDVLHRTVSKVLFANRGDLSLCANVSPPDLIPDIDMCLLPYSDGIVSNLEHSEKDTKQRGSSAAHLIVLSHGNNSTEADMFPLGERIRTLFENHIPQNTYILYVRSNSGDTHNGIDAGGTRLSKEVEQYCELYLSQYSTIYLSMIGHSLGGMYLRYACAYILGESSVRSKLIPTSFVTVCSPHLGSRRSNQAASLFNKTVSIVTDTYLNSFLGTTGKQLAMTDNLDSPLLVRMSDPDSTFIKYLKQFHKRTLVAATHYDLLVPHSSASIVHAHSFVEPSSNENGIEFSVVGHSGFELSLEINQQYTSLLKPEHEIESIIEQVDETMRFCTDGSEEQEYDPKMLNNLQRHINWRRIHLQMSFSSRYQMFNGAVHDLVISKQKPHYFVDKNCRAAQDSLHLLSRMILLDHSTVLGKT